jgi:ABC-type nickel/cobalt efflux system permease component RcnA
MEEILNLLASPVFWFCAGFIAIALSILFFLIFKRLESEKYIRLLNVLATFLLVFVGLWYTWETRGLRLQAKDQLSVMRKQFQISNAPSMIPSVVSKDKVKEFIMEDKIKQAAGKIRYSKEQFAEVLKYHVLVSNVGQKTAFDVHLYVFSATISDLILECAVNADSHGEFVSAVSHTTNSLKKEGIISGKDKGRIQKGAANAAYP